MFKRRKVTSKTAMSVQEARQIKMRFAQIAAAAIITIIVGTFSMHHFEDLSLVDSFYFSVVSLTTVGYGDITPVTDAGKLFTAGYLLVGIAIIATFINNLLKYATARRVLLENERKNNKRHQR